MAPPQPERPRSETSPGDATRGIPSLADVRFDASPDAWVPRLLTVLDTQLDLYNALDTLGSKQSELIASGDTDALLSVLGKRQTVIEHVTELNTALEPFTAAWPELLRTLPAQHREAIAQRLTTLDATVERIRRRDDDDRASLERQRQVVSRELSSAGKQRSAVSAYAKSGGGAGARYQDREG